ncbi:uracil-DNA glycosylase family protein [Variovorax dokdonensis]|uniref:uracil-DNA glycosylase family protein n=1 Tax=Variovorax dokdonensis TaxID=344883 RepID=UPI0036F2B90D
MIDGAAKPRLFALDARQLAMLDAMGVRLDWMADLQRIAARTARQTEPADADSTAQPTVSSAPAPDMPLAALVEAALAERADVAAPLAERAPAPQPAKPAHTQPTAATPRPATVLMPGAQALLADSPRHLLGSAQGTGGWLVVADMAPDALGRHADDALSGDEGRLLEAMLRALQLHAGTVPVHLVRLHRGAAQSGDGMPRDWNEVYGAEVRPLAPRMVLALGPLAAQALLQREGPIGKLRGQAQPLDDSGTAQVVASYHPAFLLKNASAKAKAWADLCLAAARFPG